MSRLYSQVVKYGAGVGGNGRRQAMYGQVLPPGGAGAVQRELMVSMAVWHGSERQRQCVRCGRALSGGAVSSGQASGAAGSVWRVEWPQGRSNVSEQCVAMCGNVAVGRMVRCGVGGQCAVVRLVFAWLPAWLPPAWLLICVAPPVASGGLRWLPRMRLACLPDTIHIPIALQFTLVAPVDVPCGGCLPVQ